MYFDVVRPSNIEMINIRFESLIFKKLALNIFSAQQIKKNLMRKNFPEINKNLD